MLYYRLHFYNYVAYSRPKYVHDHDDNYKQYTKKYARADTTGIGWVIKLLNHEFSASLAWLPELGTCLSTTDNKNHTFNHNHSRKFTNIQRVIILIIKN